MKKNETLFKIIIVGVLVISLITNFLSLSRNSRLSEQVAAVNSSISRVEGIQSDLIKQFSGFEKNYEQLGISISSFGEGFSDFGTQLSEFNGTIQIIGNRVSNLTGEIRSFSTRLPELENIVRSDGDRIDEAQEIIRGLTEGNK